MEDKASLYFDYNATTPLDEAVVGSIVDALTNFWANPSSSYPVGRHAKVAVDGARSQVASAVGCKHPDREITFTSGGTEVSGLL